MAQFNFVINKLIINHFYSKIPSSYIIYDKPDNNRKIHSMPVPLLGGIIFYVF